MTQKRKRTPAEHDEWLRDRLLGGPRLAADVVAAAAIDGISRDQLKRAKKRLNVGTVRRGFAGQGQYVWGLSGHDSHVALDGALDAPDGGHASVAVEQTPDLSVLEGDELIRALAQVGLVDAAGVFSKPQLRVLVALGERFNVARACRAAGGVSRGSFYAWCSDERFREAVELARECAVDGLENEAWDAALAGWKWFQISTPGGGSRLVQKPTRGDSRLLLRLLAVYRSDMFGDGPLPPGVGGRLGGIALAEQRQVEDEMRSMIFGSENREIRGVLDRVEKEVAVQSKAHPDDPDAARAALMDRSNPCWDGLDAAVEAHRDRVADVVAAEVVVDGEVLSDTTSHVAVMERDDAPLELDEHGEPVSWRGGDDL